MTPVTIGVVRKFCRAAILLLASSLFAQQPSEWTSGEVIKIESNNGAYDYSLFNGRCEFVGRSTKKLDVDVGVQVKFRLRGRLMLIIDRTGKTKRTQFREQWLAPPPPPQPAPKQDK
jgi:hypothetical protein